MKRIYDPEDCNILFKDGKVPVIIGYIHGDEGPRISMIYWGNKEYREASFLLTTKDYKASEINNFYGEVLQTQKAKELNLDSLVEIAKKHLEKVKN